MRKIHSLMLCGLLPLLCLLAAACSRGLDTQECDRLSEMVATARPLSQSDYASMIAQSDYLLHYLIDATDKATAAGGDARATLRDDPGFTARLDQIFTFSSVLYRAHLAGSLNAENAAAYESLDSISGHFASLCSAL